VRRAASEVTAWPIARRYRAARDGPSPPEQDEGIRSHPEMHVGPEEPNVRTRIGRSSVCEVDVLRRPIHAGHDPTGTAHAATRNSAV